MSALPGQQAGPLVTVIVPTYSHASTVDLAGRSVLEQSVHSLELVVIGDGATPEVKAAVAPLLLDERARFIDRPKTSSRAELVRDEVLREATSPYVCYLGDDDIMLPGHLAATLDRLAEVDFTHPPPVFIDRQGALQAYLTDLADPRCRLWHEHPLRNAVSLTGVGHRLDAYRRLPHGWRETPQGRWSDHYMWQQWFASPGFRYATGDRLTVLKFAAAARTDMTDEQRRAEILAWLERSRQPGFDAWLADQAVDATRRAAIELRLELDHQTDQFALERSALAAHEANLRAELVQRGAAEQEADDRAAKAIAELFSVQASRTWRIRNRLVRLPPLSWISRA
jgi:glycosyltransferase involved in cell wall biosynthesis